MPEPLATTDSLFATDANAPAFSLDLQLAFEADIGASLPDDYRRFLATHNGGRPTRPCFRITWTDQLCASRFPWDDLDFLYGLGRDSWADLRARRLCYLDRIPHDCIPIGNDPGPNQLLLAVTGPRRGQVLFWVSDYECEEGDAPDDSNVGFVAASFQAFLDSLSDQ